MINKDAILDVFSLVVKINIKNTFQIVNIHCNNKGEHKIDKNNLKINFFKYMLSFHISITFFQN